MDYQMMAIILLFVGLALMLAEFFIPSGGMISVICVICFVTSIWAAYKAWWPTGYFWVYVVSLIAIVPSALFGVLRLLESTSLGNRVLLTAPDQQEVTPYQAEQARLKALVGQTAKTVTQFNPGGMLVVEGERLHAFSEGLLIPAGTDVVIAEVRGNRLVVRPHFAAPARIDLPVRDTASQSAAQDNAPEQAPSEPELNPFSEALEESPKVADSTNDAPPLDFDLPAR
jgi:membrane-bound serine protease (ClpP class)